MVQTFKLFLRGVPTYEKIKKRWHNGNIHSSIHSFHKHLRTASYIPVTSLGTGDIAQNESSEVPILKESVFY